MTRRRESGVLFVTPWLLDGGVERVIENTVPWLAGHGHRCEVASWEVARRLSGETNPVLGALSAAGVPVHAVTSHAGLHLIQRAAVVAFLALRGRHRLLISNELQTNLVALLARRLLLGRVPLPLA
jgi:hypothetical protein